jgi:predicted dehydrogenase
MNPRFTRRSFIRRASQIAAGVGVLMAADDLERAAAQAAAEPAKLPANDRIVMGFIGMGGMGMANLGDFRLCPEVHIAAVCDVDEGHRLSAARAAGEGTATYNDYRELLARPDIDAVCISTPDHWHALPFIHACEAGKDVYCEKPVSLTIKQGRAMVNAARRYGRLTQIGTQQRGGAHFQRAVEIVRSGQLGTISLTRCWNIGHGGSAGFPPDADPPPGLDWDFWLGPAPYHPYNPLRCFGSFRFFWDYAGGTITDWGTHLMDIVHWAMDVEAPLAAAASGGNYVFHDARETPDTLEVIWDYPGFTAMYSLHEGNGYPYWAPANLRPPITQDGATYLAMRGWGYGMAFFGENGTMYLDREGFIIVPEGDRMKAIESGGSDQHLSHVKDFLHCVKTRERCRSDIETGHRSSSAPHLGNIAYWTGRKVHWDAQNERVVNDAEADRLTDRPMRAPWHL